MIKKMFFISIVFLMCSFAKNPDDKTIKVSNSKELNAAIENAVPGDQIILANGIWKDVQIVFSGKGTKEQPIILKAETAGKVFLEGESNLKIGGTFLEVNGLYFTNGYTPSNTVIDFHIDKKLIANNCKVTNTVILNYTQLNREKQDHWVEFWGRHNTLDHCYIAGKSNSGPTILVVLKGNEHINNYHQITNNHFGPRPRKGGPHGETIQLGDSSTSMSPSFTNVANNFFERCDGEVEIISNKSNNNVYKNNIFYKSEGSLVLRHGNYCTIDGNIFIGDDNSEFMGGIRVINTGHWITNNYFYNIRGNEFRSALAVMNGVPKSPLNRYNQVTDAVVAYNTFVNCISPWQFSVGANMSKSDVLPAQEIRSARPSRMVVANNVLYNSEINTKPIVNYDKVDGILFSNNITNNANESEVKDKGIVTKKFDMTKLSDWLYVPTTNDSEVYNGFDFETIKTDLFGESRETKNGLGAIVLPVDKSKATINAKNYGASWFTVPVAGKPQTIQVATSKELSDAVANAKTPVIIELTKGSYSISESLSINNNVVIQSKNPKKKATIKYTGAANTAAFLMLPNGNLNLNGVILKGTKTQNAIATLEKNMFSAYNLSIKNSEIIDFNTVLMNYKDSFADVITIDNTIFKNAKNGILLGGENDDQGEYNAEFVNITNSTFDNISTAILNYYRGGYDESTIGGNLVFNNNTVTNCGADEPSKMLIINRGIVNVTFAKNTFKNNPVTTIAILWGEKGQKPVDNIVENSGEIKVEENLVQKMMY